MIKIRGTYQDGKIELEETISSTQKINVIVTFLDAEPTENPKRLFINDFSFAKARKIAKEIKGSISASVIEERRS